MGVIEIGGWIIEATRNMEMNERIANASDVAFTVRSYEAGIANHVTLPT